MASPVDTSVKYITSDMPGAPVLNGVIGALVALTDACLNTGFGLRAVTSLVVAGGVATLTVPNDVKNGNLLHSVVLVDGVTGPLVALNGEQKLTAVSSTQLKFATAAADGTATGTITIKQAPLGFDKVFSGTNTAVYRSPNVLGTRMFVRLSDTVALSARIVGYESMSDVDVGVGPFPTSGQMAGGGHIPKSSAANANVVRWAVVGDSRGFFLSVQGYHGNAPSSSNHYGGQNRYIGDLIPTRPGGDPFAFSLGYSSDTAYSNYPGVVDGPPSAFQAMPRAHPGLGGSVLHTVYAYTGGFAYSGADGTLGAFPSAVDGGLRLSRRYASEGVNQPPRGDFPGLLTVPQSGVGNYIAPWTFTPGSGALAGRQLLALPCSPGSSSYPNIGGISFVDVTGPWRDGV